jgi:hypothetical protein
VPNHDSCGATSRRCRTGRFERPYHLSPNMRYWKRGRTGAGRPQKRRAPTPPRQTAPGRNTAATYPRNGARERRQHARPEHRGRGRPGGRPENRERTALEREEEEREGGKRRGALGDGGSGGDGVGELKRLGDVACLRLRVDGSPDATSPVPSIRRTGVGGRKRRKG